MGGNVNVTGKMRLKDSGTNYVELKAPASATATYTLTFPADDGGSGQVLTTDGAGVLTWTDKTGASSVGSNEITNDSIVNADIKSNAAIDATKINTGVVSNTEFNYLDGVTSAIQTQLRSVFSFPNTFDGIH